jgi:hypothetical protein
VPDIHHLPACIGAIPAHLNTFIHISDFLAIHCACFADLGTDPTKRMLKMRAARQKIDRSLADFCAIHQETKVICFYVFSSGLEAMIHAGLQANLVAATASGYTNFHDVSGVGSLIHGVLLK